MDVSILNYDVGSGTLTDEGFSSNIHEKNRNRYTNKKKEKSHQMQCKCA